MVVVDQEHGQTRNTIHSARFAIEQTDRIVEIIDSYGGQGARRLDGVIGVSPVNEQLLSSFKVRGMLHVIHRNLLLAPLRRRMIPVIAPVGLISDTQKLIHVVANEVILALTREFSGIQTANLAEEDPEEVAQKISTIQNQISLDRIIVLDPLGGIPSTDRSHGSHVFINLEQEFEAIRKDLLDTANNTPHHEKSAEHSMLASDPSSNLTSNNPSSKSFTDELMPDAPITQQLGVTTEENEFSDINIHIENLELLRNSLVLLPSSSSAFLTTPSAVANSQSRPPIESRGPRVRTRRQRNPLIHNLLTDKPVFSSSLPLNRSPSASGQSLFAGINSSPATFFKRGMPVSIVPNPFERTWTPPSTSNASIDLSDPRIDLSRLIYLIEDSFNRKIDVPHYLYRIKDRVAGIIIAGEYEGGAILTWESPPGFPAHDVDHMVPYLDKFAVLKRSQGAGGVADIVFKAMVRDCFPGGVCWRSRTSNPVNKWYFERAKGTWKIPRTNWTMFWTTEGVESGKGVFLDYEAVCKAVVPSWLENGGIVD